MLNGQRYPFIDRINSAGQVSTLPYFPIALSNGNNSLEVMALLDTGASVSVIPYEIVISRGCIITLSSKLGTQLLDKLKPLLRITLG